MNYTLLMYLHLLTIMPCVVIGPVLFRLTKGTLLHRRLGKIYMVLMVVTAALTLLMPAKVGPQLAGHFGFIHLLSLLTLLTVPQAIIAARRRMIRAHRNAMIALYSGAIIIAGAFTLMPGRYLHQVFFG